MVTNHLRAPYGVYFTKIVRFYVWRLTGGRNDRTNDDHVLGIVIRTVPGGG